jgi:hypothetical protein
VMTMSNLLVSELHIPNEYSLMKKWKEASIFATKFPHKSEIGVNIESIYICRQVYVCRHIHICM